MQRSWCSLEPSDNGHHHVHRKVQPPLYRCFVAFWSCVPGTAAEGVLQPCCMECQPEAVSMVCNGGNSTNVQVLLVALERFITIFYRPIPQAIRRTVASRSIAKKPCTASRSPGWPVLSIDCCNRLAPAWGELCLVGILYHSRLQPQLTDLATMDPPEIDCKTLRWHPGYAHTPFPCRFINLMNHSST